MTCVTLCGVRAVDLRTGTPRTPPAACSAARNDRRYRAPVLAAPLLGPAR